MSKCKLQKGFEFLKANKKVQWWSQSIFHHCRLFFFLLLFSISLTVVFSYYFSGTTEFLKYQKIQITTKITTKITYEDCSGRNLNCYVRCLFISHRYCSHGNIALLLDIISQIRKSLETFCTLSVY